MKTVIVGINSKYIHTMLSVRYLAASLEKSLRSSGDADSLCVFREFNINAQEDGVLEALWREKSDIYAFSVYIFNVDYVLKLVGKLKKLLPSCVVILGGPEVSYENERFLREYPEVDFISAGEGEKAFPELVLAIRVSHGDAGKSVNERRVSGAAFIYNNEYVSFLFAPPICDMDVIPFPYTDAELSSAGTKILYYESSRGCPFGCSYCLSSVDRRVRVKSLPTVYRDLNKFLMHKVRLVKFIDRTFNLDAERAESIISYIIGNDNGVTSFHFEIAPWLVSDRLVSLLETARSGKILFEVGIQSANAETLASINRNIPFERIRDAVLKLKKTPVHIHADLIAGLPYETYESFAKSFDSVLALECDCVQLGFLKLLKGTPITGQREHGYIYEDCPPYEVLLNKYISYEELRSLKRVSEVLDLFLNSGLCSFMNAGRLGTLFGKKPFEFFSGFADYLEVAGFFEVTHSTVSLFDFVYGYLSSFCAEGIAEALTAFELYRFSYPSTFPSWLKSFPDKEGFISLLNDSERLFSYFDEKAKELFNTREKRAWVRHGALVAFDFDENGAKKPRKTLFLYGKTTQIVSIP